MCARVVGGPAASPPGWRGRPVAVCRLALLSAASGSVLALRAEYAVEYAYERGVRRDWGARLSLGVSNRRRIISRGKTRSKVSCVVCSAHGRAHELRQRTVRLTQTLSLTSARAPY